jgi:hypothetical protein
MTFAFGGLESRMVLNELQNRMIWFQFLRIENILLFYKETTTEFFSYENNKQFEVQFYPNQNHSISTEIATFHLFTRITDFILNHLQ